MKSVDNFDAIYIYNGKVDFRRSIDGLSTMVQEELKMDVFQNSLFLFFNKSKNKLKILYWDKSGFALWYKRLEEERFKIPKNIEGSHLALTSKELEWLLEGYDIAKMKPHQELKYNICA